MTKKKPEIILNANHTQEVITAAGKPFHKYICGIFLRLCTGQLVHMTYFHIDFSLLHHNIENICCAHQRKGSKVFLPSIIQRISNNYIISKPSDETTKYC